MKGALITLIFVLTFAVNSKAIDKVALDNYINGIDGVILSSPNLMLSFRIVRLHLRGMDKRECTAMVGLYQTHFKGIVDYLNTIVPPADAQSTHHLLIASWDKQVEATKHMLKYCDTQDTAYIMKATEAMEESNQIVDKAAVEMEKLMLMEPTK
jgi:hypothetical protein